MSNTVPMLAVSRLAVLFVVTGLSSVAAQVGSACGVITATEISRIMGFTVRPGQPEAAGPFANHVQLPGEVAASGCFFEPTQADTKRFNTGVRITVRYTTSSGPEHTLGELQPRIVGSANLHYYPEARGFQYPVMWQNVEEKVTSFKEIPDGMMVLQVMTGGPSKPLERAEIYSDILKHALALSAQILGTSKREQIFATSSAKGSEVSTEEDVPESAFERGSLNGVRKVYFTMAADSLRCSSPGIGLFPFLQELRTSCQVRFSGVADIG